MEKSVIFWTVMFLTMYNTSQVLSENSCNLPSSSGIEWSKVTGEFYGILNSGVGIDYISTCFRTRNFKSRDDVLQAFTVSDYHIRNQSYGEKTLKFKLQENGIYIEDISKPDSVNPFPHGFDEDAKNTHDMAVVRAYETMYEEGEWSFATDYDNLIIYFLCFEKRMPAVWVHARDSVPTAEDILMAKAMLSDIGNGWDDLPLQMYGCPSKKELDVYVKEEAH